MALAKGKLPARHTMRTMRSAIVLHKHLSLLGAPPPVSNDYVAAVDNATGGDWGAMGNLTIGLCTCADDGHKLMLRSANTGQIVIPTQSDIENMYAANNPGWDGTGGDATDTGCEELSVCEYMKNTGLLGYKSDDYGSLDPHDHDALKWSIQLFGATRLGWNLPESAEQQFNYGLPWSYIPGSPSAGGHDTPAVKYDSQYIYIVSWGKLIPVEWPMIDQCVDEVHQELFFDWTRSQGLAPFVNLDLDQLDQDLKNLGSV